MSCGVNASIDEKMAAFEKLQGQYSIHVLCEALNLPRGTYYNRKRKANIKRLMKKVTRKSSRLLKKYFMTVKNALGENQYITNCWSLDTVCLKNVLRGLCKKWNWKSKSRSSWLNTKSQFRGQFLKIVWAAV